MQVPTQSQYLGKISLQQALLAQERVLEGVLQGQGSGVVLGFELEPVITLGLRGRPEDVSQSKKLAASGYAVERVDRGGQATLHNPGQLVIFPVLPIAPLGVKNWICRLVRVTQGLALAYGQSWRWDEDFPGLYDQEGKVVSLGVRLRDGVSTHGLAINVHNDLKAFSWIRACGQQEARVSRLHTTSPLMDIFQKWCSSYQAEVDKSAQVVEFDVDFCSVRS